MSSFYSYIDLDYLMNQTLRSLVLAPRLILLSQWGADYVKGECAPVCEASEEFWFHLWPARLEFQQVVLRFYQNIINTISSEAVADSNYRSLLSNSPSVH